VPRLRLARFLLALVFALGALAGIATAAYADPRPTEYILPGNAVYPEGVAFQKSTGYFYVSSTTDGTIFRGHVKEETASVFLPGGQNGRTFAAGLEVDKEGHLFISGGGTGLMFVYDANSGAFLASFPSPHTSNFINDVAVGKDGSAYFTNSLSPFLYRVYPSGNGWAMETWLDFTGTPLVYQTGFNVNGIEATPDGKYLIVVQSNTGKLFRIAIATKEVVEIDTGGNAVTAGDGLVLKGHRLYVVRNALGLISELRLSGQFTSAELVGETTDPSFGFPTTAVEARGRLLVVNSQFDRRPTNDPVLPFTVSSIKIP
jgi:Cu-Zn family superoxide dismutase